MTSRDMECLNAWPEGTVGYRREQQALRELDDIGRTLGYGRLAQLAERLRQLQDDPGKRSVFATERQSRLQLLESCLKSEASHAAE